MVEVVHLVVDAAGEYEVSPDSLLATAPTRSDGWWDRRYIAGREAIALWRANQARRLREIT